MPGRSHTVPFALFLSAAALTLAGCGSGPADGSPVEAAAPGGQQADAGGIRVVSPTEARTIQEVGADGLVVLDIRTAEEFAGGHLEGATTIDFYAPDFAQKLAELDPELPYLLYCNSGNRSGQARVLMDELGFTDVADIDGGIVAWLEAGLPVVTP